MAGSDEDYRSHFSRGPGGMKPIGILSVDVGTNVDGPRHRYESMSRTPIRDRWLLSPNSSFRRRPGSRRGGERQGRHTIGKNPAPHHFHPLIWPPQGHGDSRSCGNPGETWPAHHRTCSNETDATSCQISLSIWERVGVRVKKPSTFRREHVAHLDTWPEPRGDMGRANDPQTPPPACPLNPHTKGYG